MLCLHFAGLFWPAFQFRLVVLSSLSGLLDASALHARKYLAELEAQGLATPTSRRPLRFQLAPAGIDLLGLDATDY